MLLGIFIAILIPFSQVVAQSNTFSEMPFYWDYINVDIDLQVNGDMLITEKQQYRFKRDYSPDRNRYIPLDKVDDIKNVTVSENDKVLNSSTGKENGKFWIRWSHALPAPETHLIVLKYRVIGGLQVYGDEAQIYWKAIFADWSAPIKNATIQVNLPEALVGKIMNAKSWGVSATSQEVNSRQFKFVANQIVNPGEELGLKLSFHKNLLPLVQPKWQSWQSFTSFFGDIFNFFKMVLFGSTELAALFSIWLTIFLLQFSYYFLQFLIAIIQYISDLKCDQCTSFFSIQREYREISPSTHTKSGLRHVRRYCKKCHDSDSHEEKTPPLYMLDKTCPMCKTETIEWSHSTLLEATYSEKGLMRTNWNCTECHYTDEQEWSTLSGEEKEEEKRKREEKERERLSSGNGS